MVIHMEHTRPKPESFDDAVYRLLDAEIIGGMTAFNLTRATNVKHGEMIRILTDISIDLKKRADERIKAIHTDYANQKEEHEQTTT